MANKDKILKQKNEIEKLLRSYFKNHLDSELSGYALRLLEK